MDQPRRPRGSGFTLAEVMIVLAVLGLLTVVAVPQVFEHLRRARRAEAQAVLHEAALWLERHYSEHRQYHRTSDGTPVELPAALQSVPRGTGAAGYYRVEFDSLAAQAHTLAAVPRNAMQGDACGSFMVNHLGQKWTRDGRRTDCWVRP